MKTLFAKIETTRAVFFSEVSKKLYTVTKSLSEKRIVRESVSLLLIFISILLFFSLISFDANDTAFFSSTINRVPKNLCGSAGSVVSSILHLAFGVTAYILPLLFAYLGVCLLTKGSIKGNLSILVGSLVTLVALSALFDRLVGFEEVYYRGGIVGGVVAYALIRVLGKVGAYLSIGLTLIITALFVFKFSLKEQIEIIADKLYTVFPKIKSFISEKKGEKYDTQTQLNDEVETDNSVKPKRKQRIKDAVISKESVPFFKRKKVGELGFRTMPFIEKVIAKEVYITEREDYIEEEYKTLKRKKPVFKNAGLDELLDELSSASKYESPHVAEVEDTLPDSLISYPSEEECKSNKIRTEAQAKAFGIDLDEVKRDIFLGVNTNEKTQKEESFEFDDNSIPLFNQDTALDDNYEVEEIEEEGELEETGVIEGGNEEKDSVDDFFASRKIESFRNSHSEINEHVEEFNPASVGSVIQSNYDPNEVSKRYKGPSIDLLKRSIPIDDSNAVEAIRATAVLLEKTLLDFHVEARVVGVSRGPVITRYELEIAAGTKVSKIVGLTDNIALGLASESVRIIAPIPGKPVIGIEIPNKVRSMVFLRDVLESSDFKKSDADIPIALGKGIYGNNVVADLASAPHLLVAGTTGSGKSVCLSTIILSILYRFRPDELKFIFIDKKRVELSIYNGIPHLMAPVVSDDKKATVVLRHIVGIMEKRYEKMEKFFVRTVKAYNEKVRELIKAGETDFEGEALELFPYIVVVLDELHNLMVVASKEVEDLISRLAGMSRAVGIHLIIATQRPSADVVTGVIKANLPTRVAFQVPNRSNSRIIIDMGGAEQLLGKGDGLFCSPNSQVPERVQGAFVSDNEVKKVVDEIASQMIPMYDEGVIDMLERDENDDGDSYTEVLDDPVWDEAVQVVLNTRKASASFLQRRLKIGYNRAARIIEIMEIRGIIGPENGSKPREVLIGDSGA